MMSFPTENLHSNSAVPTSNPDAARAAHSTTVSNADFRDSDFWSELRRQVSEDSAKFFDKEPYTLYQFQVLALGYNVIWPLTPMQYITIERMKGGSNNRVTGLALHNIENLESEPLRCVVRRSRFSKEGSDSLPQSPLTLPASHAKKYQPIGHQVAILQFVQKHYDIPVPQVISFDETYNNVLKRPYMVQNFIKGVNLKSMYPMLGYASHCEIAKELGAIYRKLLTVRSSMPGRLVHSKKHHISTTSFHLISLYPTYPMVTIPYRDGPATQPVKEALLNSIEAQKAVILTQGLRNSPELDLMDRLATMTRQLDAGGWFQGLTPDNILIDLAPSTREITITAIPDWESAMFAPSFVSCEPPSWVWDYGDGGPGERVNNNPVTAKGRELKGLFEEAAGSEYLKFAYGPEYRLARILVRFAMQGLYGPHWLIESEAMLRRWDYIKQPALGAEFKACGTANVAFYSAKDCLQSSEVNLPDTGVDNVPGGVCYESGAMKSVLVTGSGCITTLWRESGCKGEDMFVPNSNCWVWDYKSVSVYC
ncbi:hypothetical protein F5Y19DRAFT_473686 [Xylariaceae sp. FL1651]|nr:hypothetical protein F5Y19DRAFT_473686 [Xylariaceae sp. FL1651]